MPTRKSFAKHECSGQVDPNTATGCTLLDQLVGTRIMMAGAELRFPVLRPLGLLPQGFPDLEGVLFYDAGDAADGVANFQPKQSVGFGIRTLFPQVNRLVFRFDFAFPLNRGPFPETGSNALVPPFGFFFAFDQAFAP